MAKSTWPVSMVYCTVYPKCIALENGKIKGKTPQEQVGAKDTCNQVKLAIERLSNYFWPLNEG